MNLRFLHGADLHLDTPFSGLSALEPAVADVLRDASLAAWDNLVELAITRRVDFVVLAGDIYDGEDRGVRAQLRLVRGLQKLSARNIPTFIIHGNHDPLGGYSAIREWPALVRVFRGDQVERVPVQREGQDLAYVYGISYAQAAMRENLAVRFRRQGASGLHVGLLHCSVGPSGEHDTYAPCELADLERADMDYWALGHVHKHTVLPAKGCWVVYSGNTQGRSPKPSECGAKGVVIVEADSAGGVRSVTHEPVDAARFVHTVLDVSDLADMAALRAALEERVSQLRAEHAGRAVLVRASLCGTGPVHADLRGETAVPELVAELRHDCANLSPLVYWESVQDHTRANLDLERIAQRGDFLCDVLKRAQSLGQDQAALAELVQARWGDLKKIPARWTRELPPADEKMILEEATRLALEMLSEAEES